ncbi:MAG: hypothetical protein ACJ798_19570 [Phenylobacterium sp.]
MDVVNGYVCHNCTDVAFQRNIDPQHPKDGPFGVNKTDAGGRGPAVVLGGVLKAPADTQTPGGVSPVNGSAPVDSTAKRGPEPRTPGAILDVTA